MAASTAAQPQFIASTGGIRSSSNEPLIENTENDQIVVPDVSFFFLESFIISIYVYVCLHVYSFK